MKPKGNYLFKLFLFCERIRGFPCVRVWNGQQCLIQLSVEDQFPELLFTLWCCVLIDLLLVLSWDFIQKERKAQKYSAIPGVRESVSCFTHFRRFNKTLYPTVQRAALIMLTIGCPWCEHFFQVFFWPETHFALGFIKVCCAFGICFLLKHCCHSCPAQLCFPFSGQTTDLKTFCLH